MASTYQLVPYLVSAKVVGYATEIRPIWDLDGNNSSMHETLRGILHAAKGRGLTDPGNRERKLEVNTVHASQRSIFTELRPGRSGIESSIRRPTGSEVARGVEDTEYVPVRYLFYFGSGSYYGVLMAERVGGSGAMGLTSTLLKNSFAKKFPSLALEIVPAVTPEILKAMIQEQPIKALVYTRPRHGDPSGAHTLTAGKRTSIEVRMKPGRRDYWYFRDLPKDQTTGEVTSSSLLSLLAPQLKPDVIDEKKVSAALLEDGWEASIDVKFPNGAQRKVNMATDHATTMSFPIAGADSSESLGGRPTNEEFSSASGQTLGIFAGQYGIDADVSEHCSWPDAEWENDGASDWEVVWDATD